MRLGFDWWSRTDSEESLLLCLGDAVVGPELWGLPKGFEHLHEPKEQSMKRGAHSSCCECLKCFAKPSNVAQKARKLLEETRLLCFILPCGEASKLASERWAR